MPKEVEGKIDEMINNTIWYSTHELDKPIYNNMGNRLIRNSQDEEMIINNTRCLKYLNYLYLLSNAASYEMSDSGKSPCNSNRVCQILKIEKPVIQGPMFWLTDAKLVAGVSEAGSLGVLGPYAGQNSLPKDDAERAERMRAEIKK